MPSRLRGPTDSPRRLQDRASSLLAHGVKSGAVLDAPAPPTRAARGACDGRLQSRRRVPAPRQRASSAAPMRAHMPPGALASPAARAGASRAPRVPRPAAAPESCTRAHARPPEQTLASALPCGPSATGRCLAGRPPLRSCPQRRSRSAVDPLHQGSTCASCAPASFIAAVVQRGFVHGNTPSARRPPTRAPAAPVRGADPRSTSISGFSASSAALKLRRRQRRGKLRGEQHQVRFAQRLAQQFSHGLAPGSSMRAPANRQPSAVSSSAMTATPFSAQRAVENRGWRRSARRWRCPPRARRAPGRARTAPASRRSHRQRRCRPGRRHSPHRARRAPSRAPR